MFTLIRPFQESGVTYSAQRLGNQTPSLGNKPLVAFWRTIGGHLHDFWNLTDWASKPHKSSCFHFALGRTFQIQANLVSCCFPSRFIHISVLPLSFSLSLLLQHHQLEFYVLMVTLWIKSIEPTVGRTYKKVWIKEKSHKLLMLFICLIVDLVKDWHIFPLFVSSLHSIGVYFADIYYAHVSLPHKES